MSLGRLRAAQHPTRQITVGSDRICIVLADLHAVDDDNVDALGLPIGPDIPTIILHYDPRAFDCASDVISLGQFFLGAYSV